MSLEDGPLCARHDAQVSMRLRSIHSDAGQPDTLVGLFECPECGHERRLPLSLAAEAS